MGTENTGENQNLFDKAVLGSYSLLQSYFLTLITSILAPVILLRKKIVSGDQEKLFLNHYSFLFIQVFLFTAFVRPNSKLNPEYKELSIHSFSSIYERLFLSNGFNVETIIFLTMPWFFFAVVTAKSLSLFFKKYNNMLFTGLLYLLGACLTIYSLFILIYTITTPQIIYDDFLEHFSIFARQIAFFVLLLILHVAFVFYFSISFGFCLVQNYSFARKFISVFVVIFPIFTFAASTVLFAPDFLRYFYFSQVYEIENINEDQLERMSWLGKAALSYRAVKKREPVEFTYLESDSYVYNRDYHIKVAITNIGQKRVSYKLNSDLIIGGFNVPASCWQQIFSDPSIFFIDEHISNYLLLNPSETKLVSMVGRLVFPTEDFDLSYLEDVMFTWSFFDGGEFQFNFGSALVRQKISHSDEYSLIRNNIIRSDYIAKYDDFLKEVSMTDIASEFYANNECYELYQEINRNEE